MDTVQGQAVFTFYEGKSGIYKDLHKSSINGEGGALTDEK
jgi:hypothetical protein